jgi:hypothetical protein
MSTLREALARAITGAESGDRRPSEERQADAALSALRQWLDENGLVVVPREATEEMLEAAVRSRPTALKPTIGDTIACEYRAAVAAAPDPLGEKP